MPISFYGESISMKKNLINEFLNVEDKMFKGILICNDCLSIFVDNLKYLINSSKIRCFKCVSNEIIRNHLVQLKDSELTISFYDKDSLLILYLEIEMFFDNSNRIGVLENE